MSDTVTGTLRGRHLLSIADLEPQELLSLLQTALRLKGGGHGQPLTGRTLALLFEKPSLRTRLSFEVAMRSLGGHCLYFSPQEVGLGVREPAKDVARVLGRHVDVIAVRTFQQEKVEEMARYATVPVINALSDHEHPTQAMADLLTVLEAKGGLAGIVLAFVGDGNNVARSLCLGAAMCGLHFRIASPQGYELPPELVARAQGLARQSGGSVALLRRPEEAVAGADVVYTDVWTSMGQEGEAEARRRAFVGYSVDQRLLSLARPDAIFLHDLPAHRGEEVSDEVMEGPQALVWQQAENKTHAVKALLLALLADEGG
jgi:ornithine carbamoyltransferase